MAAQPGDYSPQAAVCRSRTVLLNRSRNELTPRRRARACALVPDDAAGSVNEVFESGMEPRPRRLPKLLFPD